MWRNWASRSGYWGPSFTLRFNCSEYHPICSTIRATVRSLTGCPCLVNSSVASVDLLVHRSALMGLPAVVSSRIRWSSLRSCLSTSSATLAPGPGCPDSALRIGPKLPSAVQLRLRLWSAWSGTSRSMPRSGSFLLAPDPKPQRRETVALETRSECQAPSANVFLAAAGWS